MTNITPILKSLGLLDSEIKTYLAALENGAGTAVDLAKLAKLSRQAIYTAIESLTERGIMTSVEHGKKRLYAAEDPEKLLAYARRREAEMKEHIKDLERSVPELKLQIGGERPVVRMFEGREGILAMVEDFKNTRAKISHEITDSDAMYTVIRPEDLAPLRKELANVGTKITGLYTNAVSKKRPNVDRYILPKDARGFKTNLTVYDDKIALITFSGKMHSVLIESKEFADTLRILFRFAIQAAKKELPEQ